MCYSDYYFIDSKVEDSFLLVIFGYEVVGIVESVGLGVIGFKLGILFFGFS